MKLSGKFRIIKKNVTQKEGKPSYTFLQVGDVDTFEIVTFSIPGKEVVQKEGEDIELANVPVKVRNGKYSVLIELKI